jgi:large subunit ribosomal protein L3
MKSIIGTKIGMTQIYDQIGNVIPVTVIAAGPCVVTGIRTKEKDGYTAVQLGYGDIKEKALNKPAGGFFKKNNIPAKKHLREFRGDVAGFTMGQEIKADIFKPGDYVDVYGFSKGKGYAGGVKRHGFAGGPSTHGQSDRQRAPGSLGAQGWQRVIKGLRMAGHLGHEIVTIQKLEIAAVDPAKNLLLIKGAMPGPNKGIIVINETVKRRKAKAVVVAAAPVKKKGAAAPAKGKK